MPKRESLHRFLRGLQRVKWQQVVDAWKFLPAALAAPIYRLRHPDLWIVCEDANEARDNGYWFFKYVCEQHPEQEVVYAISSTSPDYEKVEKLGRTVEYGSLLHWVMYLASTKKVSSQKAGNPNAALFYLLEVYGLLKDKRIFLQHGVIKDDLKWLYYDVTKMERFICGAYPEWKYVKSKYGYPEGSVCYTGLCRFDGWHDAKPDMKQILIMPTWREWIADEDWRLEEYEGTRTIAETTFFREWIAFLTDPRLVELSKQYKVRYVFYPHRNMQKYLRYFPKTNEYITICGAQECSIEEVLKNSALMITDYSSVFFDFVYMKKPVIYYQFDYEDYRDRQYNEGYFSYEDTVFGDRCITRDEVISSLYHYIQSNYTVSDEYLREHKEFFRKYDKCNCKRVYDVVREA